LLVDRGTHVCNQAENKEEGVKQCAHKGVKFRHLNLKTQVCVWCGGNPLRMAIFLNLALGGMVASLIWNTLIHGYCD